MSKPKADRTRPITDQERLFEAEVEPLVERLFDACTAHGIPCIMAFEVRERLVCSSAYLPEHTISLLKAMGMFCAEDVAHTTKLLMVQAVGGIVQMMAPPEDADGNGRHDDDGA